MNNDNFNNNNSTDREKKEEGIDTTNSEIIVHIDSSSSSSSSSNSGNNNSSDSGGGINSSNLDLIPITTISNSNSISNIIDPSNSTYQIEQTSMIENDDDPFEHHTYTTTELAVSHQSHFDADDEGYDDNNRGIGDVNRVTTSYSTESIVSATAEDEYDEDEGVHVQEKQRLLFGTSRNPVYATDESSSGDEYLHKTKRIGSIVTKDVVVERTTTVSVSQAAFRKRVRHVLVMDAVLLAMFIPIVYFVYFIPSTYLGDEDSLRFWYYHWQWSKFVLWMLSIIIGFAYVAMITEQRLYPFHCRYARNRDFVQLLVASVLLFIIAASRTLMGPDDLNKHTPLSAFGYNYFFFASFLLGLHYTYLDKIMFLRAVGDKFGTPSLWYTYKLKEICAIVPIILFILSLVVWHCYLIIDEHLWSYYLIAYGGFLTLLIGVALLIRKTHYLHMHHYFIFGSLIPLSAFQTILSVFSQGVITGIMVEGVSRWSMGWLFYRGVRVLPY
ncbi:hypothetical protein CYY_007968 [Polysphondylium violaceum]|uniref:Transmembrane protein n=1 Tax=Polysphondylium violaceum TaxID=133409 RepID=A0A8J4PR40_9MYCE|nr:hypothetical protein CYY_007968 [Polysphondylium violaceum]